MKNIWLGNDLDLFILYFEIDRRMYMYEEEHVPVCVHMLYINL